MKKLCKIVSAFLALVLLVGCMRNGQEISQREPSSGSSESVVDASSLTSDHSIPTPASNPPAAASDSTSMASSIDNNTSSSETESANASNLNTAETTLQFYDSFRDIPFVELEYETIQENGTTFVYKGSLTKNGEPWCGTPGFMQFGERCFTDGTKLWIQVYLLPDDGFDWFQVCFDHFSDKEPTWTTIIEDIGDPPETHFYYPLRNKIFTHADGYTIYTDDGYSYTVEPCIYEAAPTIIK